MNYKFFAVFILTVVFGFCTFVNANHLNVFNGEIPQGDRVFYVAVDGDNGNNGTKESPFATLNYAVGRVSAGDVIVVRGGVYEHSDIIRMNSPNGTASKPIVVTAYPGEVPVFDFSSQPKENNYHGIRLNANYWHLIGLTIKNASHNGIRMDGSHNILEQITATGNHDTGIHMAGSASHNLIKNCDSFLNFNYDTNRTPRIGNNADGFGVKFNNIGPGNRLYGCRAWENSDDGYDFWRALETIIVENCWAFGNGDPASFGNPANFEGGGNGFKLGGNHEPGPHIIRRSLAFDNKGKGFDHNNNTAPLTLLHNTAYNNDRNFSFPNNPSTGQSVFRNNLSAKARVLAEMPSNALIVGNSWQQSVAITDGMFASVNTALAVGPREIDGSLPEIDLLKPVPGTVIINGGVDFGEPFYGTAPDMGAYELDIDDDATSVSEMKQNDKIVFSNPVENGVLWIKFSEMAKVSFVRIYDLSGNLVTARNVMTGSQRFEINLSILPGIYILQIESNQGSVMDKIIVK
ncbi:right-handed parallel beta-helix repeat-containing protein [Natronoflexus pectinivorans]|uniref:Putative secreted protein (Por secretion system target) n=1 Tax=Natronoflexus pectinivorans TaxID=682526 RepID=A0A4R2GBM5_9BACT|nr:T9SS type A sorting domain-containing protein [Natronoflexus pectinivorans]TCO05428.1 putative secreted protein (Por secretion system target) [Natronoflexus pectinivorans]